MMYSINRENEYQEILRSQQKNLNRIAKAPFVFSREENDLFRKGIAELQRTSPEELAKLDNATPAEIAKYHESEPLKFAVSLMSKALRAITDAQTGRSVMNESLKHANRQTEKSFHGVGNVDLMRAMLEVDLTSNAFQNADVDTQWMAAYNAIDARGKNEVSVRDILGTVRFYELKLHEPALLTNLGDSKGEKMGLRRFGGGFAMDSYDMSNNVWTANDLLNALRRAHMELQAWVAYREIFIKDSGETSYPKIAEVSGGSTGKDTKYNETYNAIFTLNEAARQMKENAMQVRETAKTKKTKTIEARLAGVTMESPILVYYAAQHNELINRIRRMSVGDDGINAQLLYNFVFIGTYLAPKSGSWAYTETEDRDTYGAFGQVEESASISTKGVKLVIPNERNFFATFQDLSFGQDNRATSETMVTAGFARYNMVVDTRQKALVTLV